MVIINWGEKFMKNIKNKKIILIFIIAITLIIATCLIILFIDNKQKSNNDIENQTEVNEEVNQETNDEQNEELINIDYAEIEGTISESSIMYVFDNYSYMEKTITEEISLSVLVSNNYIEDETILKLYNDGVCDAYSIVTANAVEIDGKTYLKCENYTSEGYEENHLKKETNDVNNNNSNSNNNNNNNSNNNKEEVKIITIDNYVGKNYREVKSYLESLNLYVLVEKKDLPIGESSNNYDSETIIGQSIPANSKIYEYNNITLYIPNIIARYPNFCNGTYNITDIQKFANSNNLILTIEYVENSGYETGTILYQSRAEGTNVIEGTKLEVQVAR